MLASTTKLDTSFMLEQEVVNVAEQKQLPYSFMDMVKLYPQVKQTQIFT